VGSRFFRIKAPIVSLSRKREQFEDRQRERRTMNHSTQPSGVKELPAEIDPLPLAVEPCHADRGLCGGLGFHDLVGASLLMQRLHEVITKMSLHRYRVLILGETGTGKEMVAIRPYQRGLYRSYS
jgi:transcriptional regulator with PAS, ATPase and Fis domain